MSEYRKSRHAVCDIKYHVIWATKYRCKILGGNMSKRLRELMRQGCEARDITIVSGNIRKDHIHLLLSCPPSMAPSKVAQCLKGRSSRLLQEEFQELKKRCWGQHLWSRGYFCATVGSVTEETIKQYIENQETTAKDSFKIE
ncbi:MAG: IS200/IS605 family transposase [Acidaminococcales bacterium]|jgi:putative transposase|nr:IS200/IS605 family transposase [Acidaminococcales bacterium]